MESVRELALDLRWTWSHGADALWRRLDPALWTQTENPWMLLQVGDVRDLLCAEGDHREALVAP
jgi:glycogen phosphorylase